ncbi:MAG: phospho-sugar mutase [Bacilli bacterium]|nr:phospho-sugar mutase [Bacilli bacterium]
MRTLDNYNRWLNSALVSEKDKEVLRSMNKEEIDDAFFKDVEFGTAGMRAILGPGTNRLNEFTVKKATVGFAIYLLEKYPNVKKDGIVIAHDNRHFSRSFTLLCAKTLIEFGIKTYIFDSLRPTPELSFAVRYLHCSGGIMITASHNPKEYNGYKVYDENGCQLTPEKINRLIDIIGDLPNELDVTYTPVSKPAIIVTLGNEVDDEYNRLVKSIQLHPDLDKSKFKIVFTPNHGTALVPVTRVFKELGYKVFLVESQCTPDPNFSGTKSPNPEDARSYEEPIKLAKKVGAHLVLMTDPDGDRVGMAYKNKKGEYIILNGNQTGALLLDYVLRSRKELGTMPENPVVFNTVVSSTIAEKIAEYYNVSIEQFLTGFKFIGDRVDYYDHTKEKNYVFGYEESNGALIAPFARDKDATQASLLYAEMALYYFSKGLNMDDVYEELGKRIGYYEDKVFSIMFEGSDGFNKMQEIMNKVKQNTIKELDGAKLIKFEDYNLGICNSCGIKLPKSNLVKLYFDDGSTISVRPSGTEPKIKFYVGALGKNRKDALEKPQILYKDIKKRLGI